MAGSAATFGAGMSEGRSSVAEFLNSEERPDPEENPRLFADRILLNGKVVTLDEHEMNDDPGTIAEAMAIKDGRILDLGDGKRIKKWRGPETEVVNLNGKTVLPGFVESHNHPQNGLEELFPGRLASEGVHVAIKGEATPTETVEKFTTMIEQVTLKDGEWVFCELRENPDVGFDVIWPMATNWIGTEDPANQEITREQLTEILPNNPTALGVRITEVPETGQVVRFTRTSEGGEKDVLLER